jgi:hypothetical protein
MPPSSEHRGGCFFYFQKKYPRLHSTEGGSKRKAEPAKRVAKTDKKIEMMMMQYMF